MLRFATGVAIDVTRMVRIFLPYVSAKCPVEFGNQLAPWSRFATLTQSKTILQGATKSAR
jgi:hypothetical protein